MEAAPWVTLHLEPAEDDPAVVSQLVIPDLLLNARAASIKATSLASRTAAHPCMSNGEVLDLRALRSYNFTPTSPRIRSSSIWRYAARRWRFDAVNTPPASSPLQAVDMDNIPNWASQSGVTILRTCRSMTYRRKP
jgi:hypothetical protein